MNGTLIRGCALASAGVLVTLALSGCGGGDTTSADPTPVVLVREPQSKC